MNTYTEGEISVPKLQPMKAVRAKCLDCCSGQVKEVRECGIFGCALWPYRMGKSGRTTRKPTPAPSTEK